MHESSDPHADDPYDGIPDSSPTAPASEERPAPKPPVWPAFTTPLLALILAVALQAIAAILIAVWLTTQGTPTSEIGDKVTEALGSQGGIVAMVILGPGAFGIAAWLAACRSGQPLRERLGLFPVVEPMKTYGLTMAGSIVPLAVAIAFATFVAQYTPVDTTFLKFFETVTPLWGVLFVIAIALAPGFCEEMLFRGYIQRRLIERWGPAWGIGWASVLFALAHVMPPNIAVALPLGVWLGVIAWRTGSIGPSIACHAFVNGGLNAWRLVLQFSGASETVAMVGNVVFLLAGAVAFYFACRWLARYPRPAEARGEGAGEADTRGSS